MTRTYQTHCDLELFGLVLKYLIPTLLYFLSTFDSPILRQLYMLTCNLLVKRIHYIVLFKHIHWWWIMTSHFLKLYMLLPLRWISYAISHFNDLKSTNLHIIYPWLFPHSLAPLKSFCNLVLFGLTSLLSLLQSFVWSLL